MACLFPKNELYLNDKSFASFYSMQKSLEKHQSIFNSQKITIVKGKKKSTNLPVGTIDKIIIRNSFHHFSDPEAMLLSIKEALQSGGELYLNEPTIDLNKENEHLCAQSMYHNDIVQIIEDNGFVLVEELTLKKDQLLKFVFNK